MPIQKIYFIVCLGTCLWCLGANQPGNIASVVAAYIMYGFFSSPLTPITLEHAAEMTYPIPADNSGREFIHIMNASSMHSIGQTLNFPVILN